jgi:hypothetical protein
MNARDTFLKQQLDEVLHPGEAVLHTGTAFTGPLFLASLGGVIGQLMMLTHYYIAVTNQRVILIKTGMGFSGVKCENRGIEAINIGDLKEVRTGGMANQKKLTLVTKDGTETVMRLNSMVRQVSGQKELVTAAPARLQQMIQQAVQAS